MEEDYLSIKNNLFELNINEQLFFKKFINENEDNDKKNSNNNDNYINNINFDYNEFNIKNFFFIKNY